MVGPVLYSTNPWFSLDVASRFRKGIHFAWVSDYFDAETAPSGTAGKAIAPSSNPQLIYNDLARAVDGEDAHNALIKGYKKKFRFLAANWLASGEISSDEKDEIFSHANGSSWKIWRPVLFVIPRATIDPLRIKSVPHKLRASYGPEMQITDLQRHEFDVVEFKR